MSAKYTRQVRNAVLEELRQDYVIGARMRGIKESVILWRHVLPNAMLPIVTLLGLSLGSLLGGTAVVEIIYNWPGNGKYGNQGNCLSRLPYGTGLCTYDRNYIYGYQYYC